MADKEKEKKEYSAVQVPTQYAPAIQTINGEIIGIEQSIALILNKIEEIRTLIG